MPQTGQTKTRSRIARKGFLMKLSSLTKIFTITAMTILMSHIPDVVLADTVIQKQKQMAGQMIPASSVLADITRENAQKDVENYISKSDVQAELMKHGLTADEVNSRLASLSDQEMRQLSGQVQQARAGGDILITVLVVILIIYLIQRI